jgi:hypothetical protein
VLYRLPTAGRLVRLKQRYGEQRLEAAARRALAYGDPSYRTIKRILIHRLDQEEAPLPMMLPPATTFARSAGELVGALSEVYDLGEMKSSSQADLIEVQPWS